jgi:hypothetical protein
MLSWSKHGVGFFNGLLTLLSPSLLKGEQGLAK